MSASNGNLALERAVGSVFSEQSDRLVALKRSRHWPSLSRHAHVTHYVPRNSPKYNRERPLVTFIDVEESGLDMQQSYPIEIAWVDSLGSADSFLIRPSPAWTYWEPKAETIHGISREPLIRAGLSVEQAAERLSDALGLENGVQRRA